MLLSDWLRDDLFVDSVINICDALRTPAPLPLHGFAIARPLRIAASQPWLQRLAACSQSRSLDRGA